MTYPEAVQYLESFVNYEKRDNYDYKNSFNLDRMRRLAGLLGDPQKETRSIHIAGTKGKGSTSAIVHSILSRAGFSVGLYTSPHLVSIRERIRINDTLITEEEICGLLQEVKKAVGKLGEDAPTFFEIYTALAYMYFRSRKADFAVYEVGLGGRLDATNLLEPLACGITPISYEHTRILGNRLSQIAAEKAGIIKHDSICVTAPQEKEALEIIEKTAARERAKLIRVGREVLFEELSSDDKGEVFNVFGVFGEYPMLEMGLLGSHQVANAATAIGIAEALRYRGIIIPDPAIREGVAKARWEGRLEAVGEKPYIILDGAQNAASARALAVAVKKIFKYDKLTLVLGVSKDKDIRGMLDELLPMADSVVLTKSRVAERAMEPADIREKIPRNDKDIILTSNVGEAVGLARQKAKTEDLVLVTGSLYVVGEARLILVKYDK